MGTKAVFAFAVESLAENGSSRFLSRIIGMTSDGSPKNLVYLAKRCVVLARHKGILTRFRQRDRVAMGIVRDALVAESRGWLFVDDNRNADWVSNSAIFDPAKNTVQLFAEHFEYPTGFVKV